MQEPYLQRYEVPLKEEWVILDALNYIKDKLDGTLTFRWSCRMGICGSCGYTINNEPKLGNAQTFLTQVRRRVRSKSSLCAISRSCATWSSKSRSSF